MRRGRVVHRLPPEIGMGMGVCFGFRRMYVCLAGLGGMDTRLSDWWVRRKNGNEIPKGDAGVELVLTFTFWN